MKKKRMETPERKAYLKEYMKNYRIQNREQIKVDQKRYRDGRTRIKKMDYICECGNVLKSYKKKSVCDECLNSKYNHVNYKEEKVKYLYLLEIERLLRKFRRYNFGVSLDYLLVFEVIDIYLRWSMNYFNEDGEPMEEYLERIINEMIDYHNKCVGEIRGVVV